MKSEDYYKGKIKVWQELYKEALKTCLDRTEELFSLRGRIRNQDLKDLTIESQVEEIKSLMDQISAQSEVIRVKQEGIDFHADKFNELLEWVMSIDNRSAEERLRDIRAKYKDVWENLKPSPNNKDFTSIDITEKFRFQLNKPQPQPTESEYLEGLKHYYTGQPNTPNLIQSLESDLREYRQRFGRKLNYTISEDKHSISITDKPTITYLDQSNQNTKEHKFVAHKMFKYGYNVQVIFQKSQMISEKDCIYHYISEVHYMPEGQNQVNMLNTLTDSIQCISLSVIESITISEAREKPEKHITFL